MNKFEINSDLVFKIIRFFRPSQNKWMVKIFTLSGIALVAPSLFEQIIIYFVDQNFKIDLPKGISITGWIFVTIGLLLHFYNNWLERKPTDSISVELPPDIYLFIFGQENSFFPPAGKKGKIPITIKPVKAPKELKDVFAPTLLKNWNYPHGTKVFSLYCENRGNTIGENIKIDISFSLNTSIVSVEITNKERLKILNGGKPTSNFVSFHIPQLLPNEKQAIKLVTKGKKIHSVKAWSEKSGDIDNIFIYDLIIGKPE